MLKVDQALTKKFIDGSFGLPVAHENDNYEPVPGTPYAEIYLIPNDETPLSLSGSNQTDGVFRVNLRYATDSFSIAAKQKADSIMAHFKIGSIIEYDSQKVTITGLSRGRGVNDGGWYVLPISIMYRAFLLR